MAISSTTRKKLWAKSGNRCAICKQKLVMSNANGLDYNIGEECHIVSSKETGPRHESGWADYDVYDNLILLCRNHHKTIDAANNVSSYPKQRLLEIKSKHELWVEKTLSNTENTSSEKEYKVNLISTGQELISIIAGAYATRRGHDPIQNKEDAEYIGSIWETISFYINFYHDLEPSDQTSAELELQELLNEMSQKGYFIYGSRINENFKYNDGTIEKWIIAVLYINNSNLNISESHNV